jgi:predicted patatin/cPLA2 family phospholipase
MRSAYSAGFLTAIGTNMRLSKPDMIIASSGGTGNAAYFIAEQHASVRRIWLEFLPTKRFISWLRLRPIMDIDYLIDDVFKRAVPLDAARVLHSDIDLFMPLVDRATGQVRFVSKRDNADLFELLRASKAIPFFYGKSVPLFGSRYMDGAVGTTTRDMCEFALLQGARRILIIDNRTELGFAKRLCMFAYAYLSTKHIRESMLHRLRGDRDSFSREMDECLVVRPQLRMLVINNSPMKVRAAFERGAADALALENKLRTLLTV